MRRMFTEEAFNSLGNDVDVLKNNHLYIHLIFVNVVDEDSNIRSLSIRLESRKNLSISDSFNNLIELISDNLMSVGYDYANDEFIFLEAVGDDYFDIYTTAGSFIRIESYATDIHQRIEQRTSIL